MQGIKPLHNINKTICVNKAPERLTNWLAGVLSSLLLSKDAGQQHQYCCPASLLNKFKFLGATLISDSGISS